MRRLMAIVIAATMLLACGRNILFEHSYAISVPTQEVQTSNSIPIDFIQKADCQICVDRNANQYILLHATEALDSSDGGPQYADHSIALFPETQDNIDHIIEDINSLKNEQSRASGSMGKTDYYYGSSVKIEITAYYSTIASGYLSYLKVTSLDYSCLVYNGTQLDSVAVELGYTGQLYSGGYGNNSVSYSNLSTPQTVSYPSSWPYIYFDPISTYGGNVTATVHRSSNPSRDYTLYFDVCNPGN